MSNYTINNPAASLLKDELEARGITQKAASDAMSIPAARLTDIFHGRKRISIDTSLRLEKYLGIRASAWLGMQQNHELRLAKRERADDIEREVTPAVA